MFKKTIVLRNALSICVDHHKPDATRVCGAHEIDDLGMDGWFAARELNDFRSALRSDEVVEHLLDFFHREVEARTGFGEAERTIHITHTVHLDDAEARVLLVVRAKAAVIGTAIVDFGAVGQRNGTGFVVFAECRIRFRVGVNECFERSALRAALAHVNLIVAQKDLSIDDSSAVRTNAASQFIEDVIGIFFLLRRMAFRIRRSGGVLSFYYLLPLLCGSSERVGKTSQPNFPIFLKAAFLSSFSSTIF